MHDVGCSRNLDSLGIRQKLLKPIGQAMKQPGAALTSDQQCRSLNAAHLGRVQWREAGSKKFRFDEVGTYLLHTTTIAA